MKKAIATTQPELPAAGAPVKAADPRLDHKVAKSIPAYRHATTARTVAYHQPAGATDVHLFSATGNFVATVAATEAAKNEPKPEPVAPAAEQPAPEAL